jgi:hypothetical protein
MFDRLSYVTIVVCDISRAAETGERLEASQDGRAVFLDRIELSTTERAKDDVTFTTSARRSFRLIACLLSIAVRTLDTR